MGVWFPVELLVHPHRWHRTHQCGKPSPSSVFLWVPLGFFANPLNSIPGVLGRVVGQVVGWVVGWLDDPLVRSRLQRNVARGSMPSRLDTSQSRASLLLQKVQPQSGGQIGRVQSWGLIGQNTGILIRLGSVIGNHLMSTWWT